MSLQKKRIDDLVKRLRHNGLRMTPQRQVVLKTIISSNNHPNVDEIYNHIHADYPMIGRATIYKTIAMLKEMGEITELFFNNEGARYEVSGESPHPHLICTQCNRVVDIEDDDLVQIRLAATDSLARLYRVKKLYEKSQSQFESVLNARSRVLGTEHPDTLDSAHGLGELYIAMGRYVEAEKLLTETLESRRRVLRDGHPDILVSVKGLAELYEAWGKLQEAQKWRAQLP